MKRWTAIAANPCTIVQAAPGYERDPLSPRAQIPVRGRTDGPAAVVATTLDWYKDGVHGAHCGGASITYYSDGTRQGNVCGVDIQGS